MELVMREPGSAYVRPSGCKTYSICISEMEKATVVSSKFIASFEKFKR
jgi:hypothetical protein